MTKAYYKNKIVKVIDYIGNNKYLIIYKNKKIEVNENNLIFIGNQSLYD